MAHFHRDRDSEYEEDRSTLTLFQTQQQLTAYSGEPEVSC